MSISVTLETNKNDLPVIKSWLDSRDYQPAGNALQAFLTENPDDLDAWFLMGRLMLEQDNPAMARLIYEWVVATGGGEMWQNWLNLGKAWDHLLNAQKAEECYKRALELDPDNQVCLVSLGTCYVQQYRSDDAVRVLSHALDLYPDAQMARSSLGFAYLQKREWGKGWDCYEEGGYGKLRWRNERNYSGEPRWDGTKRKSVHLAVHGEQGIGDQIAGLEPLRDLMRDVTVTAVEVSPKIRNLVARSFPDLQVFDSLHRNKVDWPNVKIDAHCGVFGVHRHYRRREEDYSGAPYLAADSERRIQWRALLDSLGPEPKVGIAWSGGSALTQRTARRAPLDRWLPILKQPCHWVSLEYKDRSEDIQALQRRRKIVIHDWPWGTQTDDYEDTAALVAELDLIVCVPTTVVHLGGAIGTPVWCMVHSSPNIHYAGIGDRLAYYGDRVTLYRRESDDEWAKTVNRLARDLEQWIGARRAAA